MQLRKYSFPAVEARAISKHWIFRGEWPRAAPSYRSACAAQRHTIERRTVRPLHAMATIAWTKYYRLSVNGYCRWKQSDCGSATKRLHANKSHAAFVCAGKCVHCACIGHRSLTLLGFSLSLLREAHAWYIMYTSKISLSFVIKRKVVFL